MVDIDQFESSINIKLREIESILIDTQIKYKNDILQNDILQNENILEKTEIKERKTKKKKILSSELDINNDINNYSDNHSKIINIGKKNENEKKTKKKIRKRKRKNIRFFSNYIIDTSSSSSGIDSN